MMWASKTEPNFWFWNNWKEKPLQSAGAKDR
jgi:hypothetical protein